VSASTLTLTLTLTITLTLHAESTFHDLTRGISTLLKSLSSNEIPSFSKFLNSTYFTEPNPRCLPLPPLVGVVMIMHNRYCE
jgi:hypothetical protein